MISDNLGKILHDKATREIPLSDEEQAQLESWYEYQDNLESKILKARVGEKRIDKLQSQIEVALAQLTKTTGRIQEIASENEVLRQEISYLHRQIVDASVLQQTV